MGRLERRTKEGGGVVNTKQTDSRSSAAAELSFFFGWEDYVSDLLCVCV